MDMKTQIVPTELDDGTIIHVSAIQLGGEEDVAFNMLAFSNISKGLEQIAKSVVEPIKKAGPSRFQVEFGLTVGVESGAITSLITQGLGTANLKVMLEWNSDIAAE